LVDKEELDAWKKWHRLVPSDNTTLRVYDLSQRSISQSVKAYDTDGDESSSGLGNADSTEILPGCAYVGV